MLGYYLHRLNPYIWEIRDGFGLRWYGMAYVLAFLCGYFLYRVLVRRGYSEMKEEQVSDFITWAAIFGVMLGGRLGYMLFYVPGEFFRDPLLFFKTLGGGMSSHGGMIGLILFTLFYAWKHQLSWLSIGDNLCVVAPVGLFFGRIANFINGELWGRSSTVPWAVQFPQERAGEFAVAEVAHDPVVQDRLRELLPPRHPSQIYEALLEGVVLFLILWLLRTRGRMPRGVLTGLFFVCYAVLRFVGEFFRVPDPAWAVSWMSAGQFLSVFLVIIGICFIVTGLRRPVFEPADRVASA